MTFVAEEVREILSQIGFRSLREIIGRTDLITQISRGAAHLDDIDLNPLLVRVDSPHPPHNVQTARAEPAPSLDEEILKNAAAFFESGEKRQLDFAVRNTHRAIGARASAHVVRRYGMRGLPEGRLTVRLRGSCGQSLGAFLVQGIALEVTGDANDYVGKGLSGGLITLRPEQFAPERADAIIGNTCLYGATSGKLFAAGLAGERFAVRNSGATAVVEGCGANGCEYMTGGQVVILGSIGENFSAGMTGGEVFVYDPDCRLDGLINAETVQVDAVAEPSAIRALRELIGAHASHTGSLTAHKILSNWERSLGDFRWIRAREAMSRRKAGGGPSAAQA
jgi:glutamate synthase (NADPH/NADH) large chain